MKLINDDHNRKRHTRRFGAITGVAALAGSMLVGGLPAAAAPADCATTAAGIFLVTADCVDPGFSQPVIDSETDVTVPVPLHKVSGHFLNSNNVDTGKKFTIYLPQQTRWNGRFFQNVYPLQDQNATDQNVAFGADSGAYTVQTNGGSGYRVDAAAAKFSETVAARYYGTSKRIYGYIWGGSGGSFQTVGAIENTSGVWDGAVPFILGNPTSIPNNFFIRAFARLVLQNKAQQIADAVRPGGSGDPYQGLTAVEAAVLHEVTSFGIPLRGWEDPGYLLGQDPLYLLGFFTTIRSLDGGYADDFWTKPGYLGTEQSALGDMVRAAKVDQKVAVTQVNRDSANVVTSLVLANSPANPGGTGFEATAYQPDGTTAIGSVTGLLDPATNTFTVATGNNPAVLGAIAAGAQVRIDNRWLIAVTSYHRHQVPGDPTTAPADLDYHAFDQFRNADGTPIYLQRRFFGSTIGSVIGGSVSGGAKYSGDIKMKVILVDNRVDVDAFPWQADWYAQRVKSTLTSQGRSFEGNFRVWFNDNADHQEGPVVKNPNPFPGSNRETRLVQFDTVLQQALRDVAAWSEKGVNPAKSTPYSVVDNQIVVTPEDALRGGIQPVVDLTVKARGNSDSGDRIDVYVGQKVTFKAQISVPGQSGKVVAIDWDHLGSGTNYTPASFGKPKQTVTVQSTFTYTTPGTYFPIIRVGSQRNGDTKTPFTVIQNLGRVRVVVLAAPSS